MRRFYANPPTVGPHSLQGCTHLDAEYVVWLLIEAQHVVWAHVRGIYYTAESTQGMKG